MKYICIVEINAPIEKVIELWQNESFFHKWQDGFESIELLDGRHNTVGAKSKIVFGGKVRIELEETIISINLPTEKVALYDHKHMTNTQITRFKSMSSDITLYESEVEYTMFKGFMIKVIARLFPGKFKAQSQKWMDQFKVFVENY